MSDDKHASTTVAVAQPDPGKAARKGYLTFPKSDKRIILIQANKLLIGRDAQCDLVIDDTRISRKHAMVSIEFDQAKFSDLNSSNGCFRGGERVSDDILLVNGDVLSLAQAFDLKVGVGERDDAITSVSLTFGEDRYVVFPNELMFGGAAPDDEDTTEADLVLPDPSLQPRHVQLECLFDDIVISALADDPPLIVADAPAKSASLMDYTSFSIGKTTFVWRT